MHWWVSFACAMCDRFSRKQRHSHIATPMLICGLPTRMAAAAAHGRTTESRNGGVRCVHQRTQAIPGSDTRRHLLVERGGDQLKFNPFAQLTLEDIELIYSSENLPQHPLVAAGFSSIGCTLPGEDPRVDRWRARTRRNATSIAAADRSYAPAIAMDRQPDRTRAVICN